MVDPATLLHLADGGPDSCEHVRDLATERLEDLERRIADLQALRHGLTRLAATCEQSRAEHDCPILHELDR